MSAERQDGRGSSELRPISIAFDELDRADGSARFAFGSTSSLASFSGPMEVRLQKDQATRATLEVVHRPLEGIGATPSRAIESALSSLLPPLLNLGQHPRSLIQLIVQSLSPTKLPSSSYRTSPIVNAAQNTWPLSADDNQEGSIDEPTSGLEDDEAAPSTSISFASRASGVNATSLAIMVASSLSLSAVPIAISFALLSLPGGRSTLVLDPTMEEEARASARFGFAWAVSAGQTQTRDTKPSEGMDVDDDVDLDMEVVWTESEGSFTRPEFEEALQLSKVGVEEIWRSMRDHAGQHVAKTVR